MPCNPLDALHDLRNQALSQLVTVLWCQRDSDCQSLLARTRAPKATDRDRTTVADTCRLLIPSSAYVWRFPPQESRQARRTSNPACAS